MSEEELKNKMDTFIECYKNGMIFGAPTDIEFYEKIATLQQKVEQLEDENQRLKKENDKLYDLCKGENIAYLNGIEDSKILNNYKYTGFVEKWLKETKQKLQGDDKSE